MSELEEHSKAVEQALINLDVDEALRLNPSGIPRDAVLAGLHIARVDCAYPGVTEAMKQKSREWLAKEFPKCDICGARVEHGTEPDSDGEIWCPTCDQAGATPSC